MCGIIKDAVSQTKDCTHELQSIMRRRRGDDMSFMIEVRKYLSSRKDVKRAMNKALKVKESQDQNHESPATVNMLKRATGCAVGLVPQAMGLVRACGPFDSAIEGCWRYCQQRTLCSPHEACKYYPTL